MIINDLNNSQIQEDIRIANHVADSMAIFELDPRPNVSFGIWKEENRNIRLILWSDATHTLEMHSYDLWFAIGKGACEKCEKETRVIFGINLKNTIQDAKALENLCEGCFIAEYPKHRIDQVGPQGILELYPTDMESLKAQLAKQGINGLDENSLKNFLDLCKEGIHHFSYTKFEQYKFLPL
jgi:hypothetical protein